MQEMTDFPQIQRRITHLTSFKDGFFDLLLGIITLMLSIYPVTRELLGPEWNIVLFLVLLAMMAMAYLVLRHFVSGPRIGHVVVQRSTKLLLVLALTIGAVLITFGVLVMTILSPGAESVSSLPAATSTGRGYLVEFIVLFITGGLFSLMAYLFKVKRLHLYGWMIGLANLASVYMTHNAGWTLFIPSAIAAGIMLLIGVVLLIRFLRKYPLREEAS